VKEFKDKVAVITGAANGIGRGIAERCVREGMKVVLAGINEANLMKAEAEFKASGGTVVSVQTDVAKRGDVELLARKTLHVFGAVHLLVNNAGVGAGLSPWEATWNDWEWVIGVNLWGVIHWVKIFHASYACPEHRVPHRQYRLLRGTDGGLLQRALRCD
jgi:NAD(P)-dependent dehydrogenase (short-subunit alcohol dehydrogenase family)